MPEISHYGNVVLVQTDMPGEGGKNWRACVKEAVWHSLKFWHRDIMPKHFTKAAEAEYGYQKRTASYMVRKAKRFHHQRPLEFTGRTKAAAGFFKSRGITERGGKGVMTMLPKYFYQRRGAAPDKVRELTALSESDTRDMADVLEERIQDNLEHAEEIAKLNTMEVSA